MKNEYEAKCAIDLYADMVRRICFLYLKNQADAEDIFQNVFLKYILYEGTFENAAHEKSWLIRITINACKDILKSFFRTRTVPLDEAYTQQTGLSGHSEVLDAVLTLPNQYKTVIYLFYYEGYTAVEIAKALHKKENTIYTWLSRGKKLLKEKLGGDAFEA